MRKPKAARRQHGLTRLPSSTHGALGKSWLLRADLLGHREGSQRQQVLQLVVAVVLRTTIVEGLPPEVQAVLQLLRCPYCPSRRCDGVDIKLIHKLAGTLFLLCVSIEQQRQEQTRCIGQGKVAYSQLALALITR